MFPIFSKYKKVLLFKLLIMDHVSTCGMFRVLTGWRTVCETIVYPPPQTLLPGRLV